MKKKHNISLLATLSLLITSCSNDQIFVWTFSDVAGLAILGLLLLVVSVLIIGSFLSDKFIQIKKFFKKK